MGHVWKPDCMPDQQKCKPKEEGRGYCCRKKQCQLASLIRWHDNHWMATGTNWWYKQATMTLRPPIIFFHSQFTAFSFPAPLCTCWLIWPCATRLFSVSPFHPHGGVSTPPRAWRRVSTSPPHRGESPCKQCMTLEYMALEYPVFVWREFRPQVGVNRWIVAELPCTNRWQ